MRRPARAASSTRALTSSSRVRKFTIATRIAVRPLRSVGARKKAPLPTSSFTILRLRRASAASSSDASAGR